MPDPLKATDRRHLARAIELALAAEHNGNLPVGAVLAAAGRRVAEGQNAIWRPHFDATRHAEIEALRAAPRAVWPRAGRLTLYTTLEPCLMCLGAILLHRIGRVVFGSADDYGGAGALREHMPPFFRQQFAALDWVGPVLPTECDRLHERLREIEAARAGPPRPR
ncbi:MAG: nucleoside deaminase [Anaerolineales bacterium]|nr:nucleoside deaminase [Anaerolineales bacterium]